MASETAKAKARLANLDASLDELTDALEPLFEQSLPESLVSLDPIQQAKLQTVLPYVVYDLVFIALKAKGIDPRTHAVVPELDRIRKYFEKIKLAEEGPAQRTTAVDKEAASRFIKHAISQAHLKNKPSVSASEVGPSQVAPIPAKVTSKMLARAEYEQELKELDEQEGSDEGGLEVFGENAEEEEESASGQATMSPPPAPKLTTEDRPGNRKRHRANVDPFAGYGDDDSEAPADITGQNASNIEEHRYRSAGPSPTPSRNLAMGAALLATPNPTWNNSPMRSMSPTMGNKSKKAKALASDSGSISSLDTSAGTTVQKGAKKEKKGRRKSGTS